MGSILFPITLLPFANLISLFYVLLGATVFKEMPQEELCFVGCVSAALGATAKSYIDEFFALYPTAGAFFETECESLAARKSAERVLRSPLGRLRRFGGRMTDSTKRLFKATMLQQIEADIVKKAMLGMTQTF